jgi:8-oxo-dGTP pyrophosphatase MutT (NUDIX family)
MFSGQMTRSPDKTTKSFRWYTKTGHVSFSCKKNQGESRRIILDYPPGMFGLIAGFVEPYKNLEQALVREVKEETGITVKNICYSGSEPWPF